MYCKEGEGGRRESNSPRKMFGKKGEELPLKYRKKKIREKAYQLHLRYPSINY